jgi:Cdc6-like AAA superfamily ATPase
MTGQAGNTMQTNPFIPDRPARGADEFIGREAATKWIRDALHQTPAAAPLTISGSRGIGKTSLLHHLVDTSKGSALGVLYTDMRAVISDNMSTFLWQLAKSIMAGMEAQGLGVPKIEKRMLVLNPFLVFRQRFWQPLLSRALETPLLLAWDNFDCLIERSSGDHNAQAIRAYLYGLLETESPLDLLLTVTGRVEALAENSLSPFRLERTHRLTNLNQEQTIQLTRYSEGFPVFEPVADFIYDLTAGHPGDVQRLCHAIYGRHQARGHVQVTVADVLAVLQHELSPSEFSGPVYRRLDRATLTVGPARH